jgi:hypothetical protein
MAFFDIATLRSDADFLARVAACYAVENRLGEDPALWAQQHSWDLAAQPGFGDAYAYALANGNEHPGRDAAVITDGQILSAVQAIGVGPVREG